MALTPDSGPTALIGIKGRNGSDPILEVQPDQCLEALNVDWFQSSLARKRGGSATVGITGGTAFSSGVRSLFRHVPADDETGAEMWGVDGAFLVKRLVAGTSWANVTMVDAVTAQAESVNVVSFNGKMPFAYKSGVNRMHGWDPVTATVRRWGLAPAAAGTVANTGGGTYAATIRYYRVCYTYQIAGVTKIRGELSPVFSFTPSGAGTAARITKPVAIGEIETHWEIYGSPDNSIFNLITTLPIATLTYDDNVAPTTYNGGTPPEDGTNTCPPAAKYLVADDARLIMSGAWETAAGNAMVPSVHRVWWTSVLGSSDVGDDERVSNSVDIKSYSDIEEAVTGMSKPVNGSFLVFSYRSQWKYVNTGDVTAPYQRFRVAGGVGCIAHKTIVTAADASGSPSTYWLSDIGPMRAGANGQQFLGQDILDIWATVNLTATTVVAHAISYPLLHQVWFYVATGASNTPDTKIVFDTFLGRVTDVSASGDSSASVRKGWSKHTGESAKAYCSVMFSNSIGATMGLTLKPYIGYVSSTAVWKTDTSDLDDAGTAFQAYLDSRPLSPWGLGSYGGVAQEPILIAKVNTSSVQVVISKDDGAETYTLTATLVATSSGGAETQVYPKLGGTIPQQANTIRVRIGDSSATPSTWNLSALIIPTEGEDQR